MKYSLEGQHSERLFYRLLELRDFNNWKKLFNGEEVATFLGLNPQKSAEELCTEWFNRVFSRYKSGRGVMNVLVEKTSRKMVGQCGLLVQNVENEDRLEIGYSILPEFQGQGYATEAARKCRNFAFENNFSDHLISIMHKKNMGSQKVAINNGMSIEKELQEYKGNPVMIYSIGRGQWEVLKC